MIYPVLEVIGLVNRFGAQLVHDGLNMEVRADEVFGIVGGAFSACSALEPASFASMAAISPE